ncbi:tropomyosin-2 [Basidiobolus ranarum]|uniref:Tropomyosin-2 n=1 Tax=Basidiobolus ranarum TaxID=34480 RepID=A0ABR2WLP1_9FUNG
MEKFKEKLNALRTEVDAANARADEAESVLKRLNDSQNDRDQEIMGLQNKIQLLEEQLETAEARIHDAKLLKEEDEQNRNHSDTLTKKINMLEIQLETAENNLRETTEKLRQVDLKAEQAERRVQQLETEKVEMESKFEALQEQYRNVKAELDETLKSLEEM